MLTAVRPDELNVVRDVHFSRKKLPTERTAVKPDVSEEASDVQS